MSRPVRLYLDTADLLEIADGRADKEQVGELRAVLASAGAKLVISKVHLEDALTAVDASTRDRFIAALEFFGSLVEFVVKGPSDIEPHSGIEDITTAPADIRELLTSPSMTEWLDLNTKLSKALHESHEIARKIVVDANLPNRALRKQTYDVLISAALRIFRSRCTLEPDEALALTEAERGAVPDHERDTVLTHLTAFGTRLFVLLPLATELDVDLDAQLTASVRAMSEPNNAPGAALSLSGAIAVQRDRRRPTRYSDTADMAHLAYLPYVDVATADAAMRALNAVGLRTCTARVLGHRDLAGVVEALRTMHSRHGASP